MKTEYESPLEHSSSPDGCREDCPACEDERLHTAGGELAEALQREGQDRNRISSSEVLPMKPEPKTKVIFRVFPAGDVLALFPAECGDSSPYTCSSYQHVGQHGAADPYGMMAETRPAKRAEYRELAAELRRIGYRLRICQKMSRKDFQTRKEQLKP